MIRRKLAVPLAFALGIVLLDGCGSPETLPARANSSAFAESSKKSMTESSPESGSGVSLSESGEGVSSPSLYPEKPDESLPYYLQGVTSDWNESAEPYNPEGLAVIPGEPLDLHEDAKATKIGETVTPASALGFYDLTVNAVRLIDERVESFPADKVVRVTYTYKSTDYDTELMVGSHYFRLYDQDGKACSPYFFRETEKDSIAEPLPPGESCTASVCFILPEGSTKATLVFDDLPEEKNPDEFYWELSF